MIAEYYDEQMNLIDTQDLITTHLHIPSTNFDNRWTNADGISPIFMGADADQKQITATIELVAHDYIHYSVLKDKLNNIFGFNTPFYVVDKRMPGKRHKVILESNFLPTRYGSVNGSADIPFITVQPFAESIGTTQDIETNFDYRIWTEGMGLLPDNESRIYTHESTEFQIYNAGIPIHPFEQELTITIDNVEGSTDYLELENTTNGTLFKVNESVSNSQTIVLDGHSITSNGLAFLRSTNKQFIELAHGWNDFIIRGATSARVNMNFRYYYH